MFFKIHVAQHSLLYSMASLIISILKCHIVFRIRRNLTDINGHKLSTFSKITSSLRWFNRDTKISRVHICACKVSWVFVKCEHWGSLSHLKTFRNFTVLTFFIIPFQYCCALARSGDEWHTKEFLTLTDSVHALAVWSIPSVRISVSFRCRQIKTRIGWNAPDRITDRIMDRTIDRTTDRITSRIKKREN